MRHTWWCLSTTICGIGRWRLRYGYRAEAQLLSIRCELSRLQLEWSAHEQIRIGSYATKHRKKSFWKKLKLNFLDSFWTLISVVLTISEIYSPFHYASGVRRTAKERKIDTPKRQLWCTPHHSGRISDRDLVYIDDPSIKRDEAFIKSALLRTNRESRT